MIAVPKILYLPPRPSSQTAKKFVMGDGHGAVDHGVRRVITAHRVDRNADHTITADDTPRH